MSLRERFIRNFGVWAEATDHIELMVDEEEMRLAPAVAEGAPTAGEVARRLGCSDAEAGERVASEKIELIVRGKIKRRRKVRFVEDRCWGCGRLTALCHHQVCLGGI